MKTKFEQVYQFMISLQGLAPTVWRRIQVPETYSLGALHVAIQDAMGWNDCHLHAFDMNDPAAKEVVRIGVAELDEDGETLSEWEHGIADYFSLENCEAEYTYDFGDSWVHIVKLEAILPREAKTKYPRCVAGEMACPPEDCGGVWGYEDLLKIIKDPKHEMFDEMMDWLGKEYNAENFDARKVRFDDPDKRRLMTGW